jgi:sugar phosphate isomerase/epimerase
MSARLTTRRRFLQRSAGIAAATTTLRPGVSAVWAAATSSRAVRLGGPVFDVPPDPEAFALAHRKLGYRAAYCPDVRLSDKERIRDYAAACAKHDVVIAEVGRWCNLLEADTAKHAANMATVTDGLALAEAIGAKCCVDCAGSFNKTIWFGPHPDNLSPRFFDAVVENARKIIDAVEPRRAKFSYEMMGWSLPDGPDAYLKLIKAIDRPAFGVHLDPCNAICSPEKFYHSTALLNECFDKLGPWLVSCHAKDLTWDVEMNVHFREVCLGTGSLDYATYLKRLAALPNDVPLMIEHMKDAAEYDRSRQYLLKLGGQIGVSFG